VFVFVASAPLCRHVPANLCTGNAGSGVMSCGLHQHSPFASVGPDGTSESSVNHQMSKFVAQGFFEQGKVVIAQQYRIDIHEIAPGFAQPE